MQDSALLLLFSLHNLFQSWSSKSFISLRAWLIRCFNTLVCRGNILDKPNDKPNNASSTHPKHHRAHTPYSLDIHRLRHMPVGALGNARIHSTHSGNVPAG